MLQTSYNIFTSAIHEEINDLIKSYVGHEVEDSIRESFIDNDGHILIPLNSDSYLDELFTDYTSYYNGEDEDDEDDNYNLDGETSSAILSEINIKNISKIKGTPSLLREILLEMFANQDSSIYGITVVDNEKRYNVLHPITAYMIKHKEIILSNDITIMIYSYKYKSDVYEEDKYINKISNILNTITDHKYKSKSVLSEDKDFNLSNEHISKNKNFLDTDFRFIESGGARPQYGILPVQFMTDSVSFPYYGIIASSTSGGNYISVNLSGMASGNLSIDINNVYDYYHTCTGDEPNHIFNSLYTLNDMNLFSLYDESIIHDCDWRNWVFTCQMSSIYLMYSDTIDKQEQIKKEELKTSISTNEAVETNQSDDIQIKQSYHQQILNQFQLDLINQITGAHNG